ncbi:hypothetical protein ABZ942_11170 [Nocardia sp. NPDC046473]|uniref:hypothetical protein n=1 Tax=Nocardia sp. NPDC046473 TaxID=3155733 RepID=UPI0033CF053C
MPIDLSFFRSETSQRLRDEGWIEGWIEGLTVGRVIGILRILESRGFVVEKDVRDRITSCTDLGVLRGWLRRSATVAKVDDLFVDD